MVMQPERTARGVDRREKIVLSATRFIARHGARGTTLAQIAKAAGVSQAGLIYHYGSKDELLHAVLDRHDAEDRYAPRDHPSGSDGLAFLDAVVEAVRHWQTNPDSVGMHSVLVAENAGQEGSVHERLSTRYWANIDRLAGLIVEAQEAGEVRKDVSARRKAVEVVAFINGLETAWLLDPTVPAAETAEQWCRDQRRALRPAVRSSARSASS